MYEFQFGSRPHDKAGPNYGIPESGKRRKKSDHDARTTTLDELELKADRVFGYWFDFGDDWFHQVEVERIEQAIPTVWVKSAHSMVYAAILGVCASQAVL
ncbi:MAG: hypothetical protein O3A00_15420, partial [Planctomycetota bacterium]|nr:hypothetical protein [Planctomycetota bacterium]